MNRFASAEVVFSTKLTPAVSPSFQKTKMGERTRLLSSKFRFWNLGEAGEDSSLIENLIYSYLRISGFMSLLNLTL